MPRSADHFLLSFGTVHVPVKLVPREAQSRGYEIARDTLVEFTDAELDRLDGDGPRQLTLEYFVPGGVVSAVDIERTWYLGPDKGGDAGVGLLHAALRQSGRVALGRRWTRGREQLCAVRPLENHLVLHELFYTHERVETAGIPVVARAAREDIDLAVALIESMAEDEAGELDDRYLEKIEAAAHAKLAGGEVLPALRELPPATIDLGQALRASLKIA